MSPVVNEFHFKGPFLSLGQNIGLLVGAAFWGVGSDVWGRRYVLYPAANPYDCVLICTL